MDSWILYVQYQLLEGFNVRIALDNKMRRAARCDEANAAGEKCLWIHRNVVYADEMIPNGGPTNREGEGKSGQ